MNFISEALGSQSQHSRTKKDQQSLETKFQLYTDTTGEACQILFNQLETLDKCSFNASLPLVMIVHGWSVWTHILFLTQTTSDLIYFPPRYASAKSNFRRKTGISKMVAIIEIMKSGNCPLRFWRNAWETIFLMGIPCQELVSALV